MYRTTVSTSHSARFELSQANAGTLTGDDSEWGGGLARRNGHLPRASQASYGGHLCTTTREWNESLFSTCVSIDDVPRAHLASQAAKEKCTRHVFSLPGVNITGNEYLGKFL